MADGRAILPVIEPGGREGPGVSILTDPFMLLESFRRGWIKTAEEAQKQYERAVDDVQKFRDCGPSAEDMAIHQANLAKLALAVAALCTKNVQIAHAQTQEARVEQHNHLHLHGERDPKDMSDEELASYIDEQKRRLA